MSAINAAWNGLVRVLNSTGIRVYVDRRTPLVYSGSEIVGVRPHTSPKVLTIGLILEDTTNISRLYKLAEPIAAAADCHSVIMTRENGTIWVQFSKPESEWTVCWYDGSGIGVSGFDNKPVSFEFQEASPHTLVAGSTGSGKTIFMLTLLQYLVEKYTPEQMGLFVADPHGDYVKLAGSAHLALPIAEGQQDIADLVNVFKAQLEGRKEKNIRDGKRLILFMDEAQSPSALGTKDGGFNQDVLDNLIIIAREGRKYRVHLIIGTQDPNLRDMPFIKNLTNRYIGKLADPAVAGRIAGANSNAHNLLGAGDFLHLCGGHTVRLQAAMVKDYHFPQGSNKTILHSRRIAGLNPQTLAEFVRGKVTEERAKEMGLDAGLYATYKELAAGLKAYL